MVNSKGATPGAILSATPGATPRQRPVNGGATHTPYTPSVAPALGGWVHAANGGRHLVPMPPFPSGYETVWLSYAFALCHQAKIGLGSLLGWNTAPKVLASNQFAKNDRVSGVNCQAVFGHSCCHGRSRTDFLDESEGVVADVDFDLYETGVSLHEGPLAYRVHRELQHHPLAPQTFERCCLHKCAVPLQDLSIKRLPQNEAGNHSHQLSFQSSSSRPNGARFA